MRGDRRWQVALLAVAALTVLRLALSPRLGLAADEAYYYCWSQELAWGYFDHPPMVAALIRLGTSVLGTTEFGLRAPMILCQGAGFLLLLHGCRERGRSSLLALLLLATPLFFVTGLLATPDAILCAAWCLGLYAADRKKWRLLGLACGVAVLSKATGWLLWPALWLAGDKRERGLYTAGAVLLLVALPHLAWSAQHDWVSFRFQLAHGLGPNETGGLGGLAAFFGGQALLVGPVLLGAALVWWIRGPIQPNWWWTSILPMAVFCGASLLTSPEPNWALPAWIGVSLGLAHSGGRLLRAAWLGGSLAAAATVLLVIHAVFPLWQLPRDPLDRLALGEQLGPPVEAWGEADVVTARYQEAAWLVFYEGLEATTLPGHGRRDQFDLWREAEGTPLPEEALFVQREGEGARAEAERFYDIQGGARVQARRGGRLIGAWEVYNARQLR